MEMALVENLQREDLNPLETAAAYQALMDSFGLTKEQLATRLGKSRAAVVNTLRLTRLPESIQALVLEEKLTEGHARALLARSAEKEMLSEEQMLQTAERVQVEKLSVRKTEELVREELAGPRERPKADAGLREERPGVEEYGEASRRIQDVLMLPTSVRSSRQGGKLEIRFREKEELEALVTLLTANGGRTNDSPDGVPRPVY
jgi:ParB family chromosome partitioning protein